METKHNHLLEVARALIFQANLPKTLWSECMLAATHLINKLPTLVLNWRTPFEILHGRIPEYKNLRTVGSLYYATITKPHKDKFAHRAIKCIMLGYVAEHKGYRLLDLVNKAIFASKDVVFHEDSFPYKILNTQSSPIVPLPIVTYDDEQTEPSNCPIPVSSSSQPIDMAHESPQIPLPINTDVAPVLGRRSRSIVKPAWL